LGSKHFFMTRRKTQTTMRTSNKAVEPTGAPPFSFHAPGSSEATGSGGHSARAPVAHLGVRCKMKFAQMISLCLAVACALTACESSRVAQDTGNSEDVSVASQDPASSKRLTVSITGEARGPGLYQLPAGAVLQDALDAVAPFTEFGWWSTLRLTRAMDSGDEQVILLTSKRRDRQRLKTIPLEDGDRIHLERATF
jgi:hypothetical protein